MYYAIITAGGSGIRMNNTLPKQFLNIRGKPILIRTIEKFYDFSSDCQVILTLPEAYFQNWESIRDQFLPKRDIKLVEGGKTRFDSIKNGLNAIEGSSGLVAIHDAVRPFVTVEIIENAYKSASEFGSGVTSIPLRDSIREISESGSAHRDRNSFRLMQTPQTFDLQKIKAAYSNVKDKSFTDDAGVWEAAGYEVKLIDGTESNIKITFKEDLIIAEAILNS